MDTIKMVEVNGQFLRLYTVNDLAEKFKETFPEGMKIPVGKVDMDTLAVYRFYPNERWMKGMPCSLQTRTGAPDNYLNVEVRLQPEEYLFVIPFWTHHHD